MVNHTALAHNPNFSQQYNCNLYLKREDLQVVRSYKIRGALNKMSSLGHKALEKGIVCASAGNHAQGVAFACQKMQVPGRIYMPTVTPLQKIKKVEFFGKEMVEVILFGDTFDDSFCEAKKESDKSGKTFIHPFDDYQIIEGQGTVGLEILEDCPVPIDFVFVPVGGGGLISGIGSYFRTLSPNTKIIGVEPLGAPAMYRAFEAGQVVALAAIDNFVDGAAVKKVGELTYRIARQVVEEIVLVPEGKVCSSILQLYNEEGIVVEPAGALSIGALDFFRDKIKGKNVVCVLSGSNNDITRTEEIRERSLIYEGLKHYFIIRFPQRPGALRDFLNNILGPQDDITHFEYFKKHNRESGPAVVGIQLRNKDDYEGLIDRMNGNKIQYQVIKDNPMLFELLI